MEKDTEESCGKLKMVITSTSKNDILLIRGIWNINAGVSGDL